MRCIIIGIYDHQKGEVERSRREVVDGICMVVQKKAKVREVEKL